MNQQVKEIQEKIVPILKMYAVNKASIFGSTARGDAKPDSDIDILVNSNLNQLGYFEFIEMQEKISNILGKNIDLIEEYTLKPIIKDFVNKDKILIYEK